MSVGKRAFSLPLNHPEPKKSRTSLDAQTPPPKWKTRLSPSPGPSNVSKPPTQGTERIACPGIDLADTKAVNDLLVRHTQRLAREGKRLVHAPRFLDDGINFDWILDYSADQDRVKDLFTVKRIDKGVLLSVLHRHTITRAEAVDDEKAAVTLLSESKDGIERTRHSQGRDAENPILIDDEDNDVPAHLPLPEINGCDVPTSIKSAPSSNSSFAASLMTRGRTPSSRSSDPTFSVADGQHRAVSANVESENTGGDMEISGEDDEPVVPAPGRSDSQSVLMEDTECSGGETGVASVNIIPLPTSVLGAEARAQPDSGDEISGSGDPRVRSNPTETSNRDSRTSPGQHLRSQSLTLLYGGFALNSSSEGESSGEDEAQRASPERLRQPRRPTTPPPTPVPSGSHNRHHTISRRRSPRAHNLKVVLSSSSSDDKSSDDESSSTGSEKAPASLPRRRAPLDRPPEAVRPDGDVKTQHEADGKLINVPKTSHARGRRLLALPGSTLPYVTVAMRGDAQFIDKRHQFWISRFSLPWPDEASTSDAHVTDACLLGDREVVVGYDSGPSQVSIITVDPGQSPRRFDVLHRAHTVVHENRLTGTSRPYRGISALAPLSESRFLSGGHDKTVHLWTVARTADGFAAKSQRLNTSHSQRVQAVAYRARDNSVLSAAGESVCTMRLADPLPPDPIRVSGRVLHIHVHPQAPNLVVLEVAHMDRQIQLYDMRKGGFGRAPCIEFGYRIKDHKDKDSRYVRGSPWNSLFARGYGDGAVRVWDYREPTNVMITVQCQRPAPVAHALLSSSDIIAYGGHSVTIWSLNGGRS